MVNAPTNGYTRHRAVLTALARQCKQPPLFRVLVCNITQELRTRETIIQRPPVMDIKDHVNLVTELGITGIYK